MNDRNNPTSNAATKAAHVAARALAAVLFHGPCTNFATAVGSGTQRCLEREHQRPLTRAEKARGWLRRPWSQYERDNLCRACCAYWHAELAAIVLDDAVAMGASVVTEGAAGAPPPNRDDATLVDIEHNGVRFTIEHDASGFRVTRNGLTAWHELASTRTSTLPQALQWLEHVVSTDSVRIDRERSTSQRTDQ